MKLFVWRDPYDVPYGGTCLFVVAENEEQARASAPAAEVTKFGHNAEGGPALRMKLGAPDWVRDMRDDPYAFIYHWEE